MSQLTILSLLTQEVGVRLALVGGTLPSVLHLLYEHDILSEDAILRWHRTSPEGPDVAACMSLRKKVSRRPGEKPLWRQLLFSIFSSLYKEFYFSRQPPLPTQKSTSLHVNILSQNMKLVYAILIFSSLYKDFYFSRQPPLPTQWKHVNILSHNMKLVYAILIFSSAIKSIHYKHRPSPSCTLYMAVKMLKLWTTPYRVITKMGELFQLVLTQTFSVAH